MDKLSIRPSCHVYYKRELLCNQDKGSRVAKVRALSLTLALPWDFLALTNPKVHLYSYFFVHELFPVILLKSRLGYLDYFALNQPALH